MMRRRKKKKHQIYYKSSFPLSCNWNKVKCSDESICRLLFPSPSPLSLSLSPFFSRVLVSLLQHPHPGTMLTVCVGHNSLRRENARGEANRNVLLGVRKGSGCDSSTLQVPSVTQRPRKGRNWTLKPCACGRERVSMSDFVIEMGLKVTHITRISATTAIAIAKSSSQLCVLVAGTVVALLSTLYFFSFLCLFYSSE